MRSATTGGFNGMANGRPTNVFEIIFPGSMGGLPLEKFSHELIGAELRVMDHGGHRPWFKLKSPFPEN